MLDFPLRCSIEKSPVMSRRKPTKPLRGNAGCSSTASWCTKLPGEWKRNSPAAIPSRLTEESLPESDGDRIGRMILPLKNGAGRLRVNLVRFVQSELLLILREEPELLPVLYALAEGRGDGGNPEQRERIRKWGLLTRSGEPRPEIRAVMLAGYRQTPAGPVITEPLDLSDPKHAAAIDRYTDSRQAMIEQYDRKIGVWLAKINHEARQRGDGHNRS